MNECEHKWVFQETKKKTIIRYQNGYTAYFDRTDIYYCEKCCEIKKLKKESMLIYHLEAFIM